MIPVLLRLLGAAVAIALLVRWLRSRMPTPEATQDTAKNPDLWDSMSEHFQELDRELELAKHWSDGEVALAVEQYVFKLEHSDDDHDDLVRKLSQQATNTVSQVLRVVRDPDMQTRLRKEPRGEPALYRACQLLMVQPTGEAVAHVRRLLAAESDRVRLDAFQWLAQICDQSVVDDLAQGLRNGDERVPAAIVTGLERGKHAANTVASRALFEPLAALVEQAPTHITENASSILLAWDREKALTRFEQEGILAPGHAAFADVMTAIHESRELLPRDHLVQVLKNHDLRMATVGDATALLRMLAGHRHDEDRTMLHDLLEQPGPIAGAAATALLTAHGLEGWVATILNESRQERSAPENQAFAIWMLDCDLRNGGFHQYFANPSSSHSQSALAGLREADDHDRADLLTEAIERSETKQAAEAFADLDTRYHELPRPVQVTLTRIILANLPSFR